MYLVEITFLLVIGFTGTEAYVSQWLGIFSIPTDDNVKLSADGYIPVPTQPNQTFPLLVFPNSWGVPQIEYLLKVHNFAKEGYVAIEYETRGWWLSGGEIQTAGPVDRKDAANVLTYCLQRKAEWHIDESNVAFVGISYGAGISLMAAGNDTRVKTAVAMSGWGNLLNGFYYHRSPNKHEADSLLDSALKNGHPSPDLIQFRKNLLDNTHLNITLPYAADRSPEGLFLDDYNRRSTPIFLSNNMLDRIFYPQAKVRFWGRLTGPKFMLVNQGKHAEPEAIGLTNIENYIWGKVSRWLRHWLKNEDTGIMSESPLQVQHGSSMFSPYLNFSSYPDPQHSQFETFYLGSRGNGSRFGVLSQGSQNVGQDTIQFSTSPPLFETAGKADDAWSLGFPPTLPLGAANMSTSITYLTQPLISSMTVCGSAKVNLTIHSSHNAWQIYGFLMDVSGEGTSSVGQLMADTCYTHWASDGRSLLRTYQIVDLEFRTVCRDVSQGHRLGVGFVLYNDLYSQANTSPELAISLEYGSSVLEIPSYQN